MTLVDIQRRIMEAGRIRIGQQIPIGNGKTRPEKLDTFRLTSADRTRIDQAAKLYGGQVTEWSAPAGKQWQVVTDATSLDVIVPPSDMAFSQAYEVWSAGGCQRRCDGAWEQITDQACICDPAGRECDVHTRLSVMLRDLPGLGLWRIDTQGWNAAHELAGAVQVIAAAAGRGVLLPARLMLQQRSVIRRGDDGKPQTRRFAVPVLDIEVTPGELLGGAIGGLRLTTLEEPKVETPALLARVPDSVPEWPVPSIAEQAAVMDTFKEPKPRANAAQPIPPTGLEPRTAAEAGAVVDVDEAPGEEPTPEERAWIELTELLATAPATTDTKPVLEGRLRNLYSLMEFVGLWPRGSDGSDALHMALRKHHQVAHVGDLNKEPLLDFCRKSWEAARTATTRS